MTREDIDTSVITDHVWISGDHLPILDEVEIIDTEHHWKKKLKWAAHMQGHNKLLCMPSAGMSCIWEQLIRGKWVCKT